MNPFAAILNAGWLKCFFLALIVSAYEDLEQEAFPSSTSDEILCSKFTGIHFRAFYCWLEDPCFGNDTLAPFFLFSQPCHDEDCEPLPSAYEHCEDWRKDHGTIGCEFGYDFECCQTVDCSENEVCIDEGPGLISCEVDLSEVQTSNRTSEASDRVDINPSSSVREGQNKPLSNIEFEGESKCLFFCFFDKMVLEQQTSIWSFNWEMMGILVVIFVLLLVLRGIVFERKDLKDFIASQDEKPHVIVNEKFWDIIREETLRNLGLSLEAELSFIQIKRGLESCDV